MRMPMVSSTLLAVSTLMLRAFAATALSAAGQGSQQDPVEALRPPPLSSHVMVYHGGIGEVLLFGGSDPDRKMSNALWAWNGQRWSLLSQDGPEPRIHAGLAYDESRDRLVLFGGIKSREQSFGDLWEWDGKQWEEREQPRPSPGIRDHHALVYDPSRRGSLLFGGQDQDDSYPPGSWLWDGKSWQRIADSGPAPRSTHRLAYDRHRARILLVAGWGPEGLLGDTWEWDGKKWSQSEGHGPTPRGATRFAYDEARRQLVLFGGLVGREGNDETWIRGPAGWQRLEVPGPPARNVHAMAYDPMRERVVLYGGIGAEGRMGDLWEWDGKCWVQLH